MWGLPDFSGLIYLAIIGAVALAIAAAGALVGVIWLIWWAAHHLVIV